MSINIGDPIPEIELHHMTEDGVETISSRNLMGAGTVVLFALPGAFTPTCSAAHLPGYVVKADELRAKGVDRIICLAVNDAFVMHAWGEQQNVDDRVQMIADGSARFTRAIGLELDREANGMGIRSQRYAMLIRDGVVEHLQVEKPGEFEVSSAEAILRLL